MKDVAQEDANINVHIKEVFDKYASGTVVKRENIETMMKELTMLDPDLRNKIWKESRNFHYFI